MADVFLSYAREDRARAEELARAIESKGWTVWCDRKLQVGKSFSRLIEQELDDARCVIVLWSRHSVDSHWVLSEASEGLRRGVLVPIAIEAPVKLRLEFRGLQTASLVAWPGKAGDFDDCMHAIEALVPARRSSAGDNRTPPVAAQPGPAAQPFSYTPPPPRPVTLNPHRGLWLVLSYLGAFSLLSYFGTKHDTDPEVRWHARNGLSLFLAELVILGILMGTRLALRGSAVGAILTLIQCLAWLAFVVISIISMIKSIRGQRFTTPIVTRFAEHVL